MKNNKKVATLTAEAKIMFDIMNDNEYYNKCRDDKEFVQSQIMMCQEDDSSEINIAPIVKRINRYARKAYKQNTGIRLDEGYLEHLPFVLLFGEDYINELGINFQKITFFQRKMTPRFCGQVSVLEVFRSKSRKTSRGYKYISNILNGMKTIDYDRFYREFDLDFLTSPIGNFTKQEVTNILDNLNIDGIDTIIDLYGIRSAFLRSLPKTFKTSANR